MFSFKVFAGIFPPVCIIVGGFLLYVGYAVPGYVLIVIGFVSFVIALLAKIFGKNI